MCVVSVLEQPSWSTIVVTLTSMIIVRGAGDVALAVAAVSVEEAALARGDLGGADRERERNMRAPAAASFACVLLGDLS